jgi:SAM-dependent methyltransferase
MRQFTKNNTNGDRELPLPRGINAERLFKFLESINIEDSGDEIKNYLLSDFERFVQTYGLIRDLDGAGRTALELGANPYFASLLFREFSQFKYTYANYFGDHIGNGLRYQKIKYSSFNEKIDTYENIPYFHFNLETDHFPFANETFDLVCFCEIIEHLIYDPVKVIRKIRSVLKPEGYLILTTPNILRSENIKRLIDGENISDPYSGYGPYGRHNREYTLSEIESLLTYLGFSIEEIFTANVHPSKSDLNVLSFDSSEFSKNDASTGSGQYIFVRAKKIGECGRKLPAWLYRSFPESRLAVSNSDKQLPIEAGILWNSKIEFNLGETKKIEFTVLNIGFKAWSFDLLRFGARCYDTSGKVIREFRGTSLSHVAPGDEVKVEINIDLSGLTDGSLIVCDLCNENNFWFEDLGSEVLKLKIE